MSELILQSQAFENIKALCANYKKDSSSRKTTDYLTKKLVNLETQWRDFDERNNILQKSDDKSHQYYMDNIYERTKASYEELKSDILLRLQSSISSSSGTTGGTSQTLHVPEGTQSTSRSGSDLDQTNDTEKVLELLVIQKRNFRAIQRALSKISIDHLSDKWELEDNLSVLKSKWTEVDKLHWELDGVCKDPSYYHDFETIEHQYDTMKKSIMGKISSNIHFQQSAPRIEVPEFSGNYSQWISFKDLFLETVDKNPCLSKAQKMQHLKSKLRGEAEKLIQHLHVNSDNYESCWEILAQRYDNRRLLFTSFINTMINLPTIQQANAYNLKRMHDVIVECLNGLDNIGIETHSWSPIIAHLMALKLDTTTYSEYTKELQNPREIPNINELNSFLENKFMAFETLRNRQKETFTPSQNNTSANTFNKTSSHKSLFKKYEQSKTYHVAFGQCPLCDGKHVLMQCRKFLAMDSDNRNATAAKLNVCRNCLYQHGTTGCSSEKTCKECNLQHHTLLHKTIKNTFTHNHPSPGASSSSGRNFNSNHASDRSLEILLATALLQVKASNGTYVTLRALLDQGSQVNLISENAAQLLNLTRTKVAATISGVGSISGDCRGSVLLECKSTYSDYTFTTSTFIMRKLINPLPNKTFNKPCWEHLENLKLADPDYNVSRGIDLLLGASIYSDIIMGGVLKADIQSPTAQQTKIGWILCGNTGHRETFNCHVTLADISDLSRFWDSEDILTNKKDISDEDYCERYYQETTQRHNDGKYVVKMPMIPNYEENLGKSKNIAISQLIQLEKRLAKNHVLASRYNTFIEEYIGLGHMTPSTSRDATDCFLPHHGVLREQSTTTKLRVVFNASQKTSSGYSLNELMYKGPNLQKDIQELLIKWRSYKYVFIADIEKHYRSIWLSEDQQALQKIIWRDSNNYLQEMKLQTVTYGTKCAPWLAMRTLEQLAIDDGHIYPDAAEVLRHNFYVDDLIGGHHSLEAAKRIQTDLIKLLAGGGMNLRKWSSNSAEILQGLSEEQISTHKIVDFKTEDSTKTLGLSWSPQTDSFKLKWDTETGKHLNLTKSELLSQISKLYDPLGWFSPVTITAKLLFQTVWSQRSITWNDKLPKEIDTKWAKLKADLPLLRDVIIKRWIGTTQGPVELFAFCDASQKAYSCAVYSRVKNSDGQQETTLIAGKTRVTPLAEKMTLPRLELCGALLLSQLVEKISKSMRENNHEVNTYAWCDSQVVLAWLQGEPSKFEKYVTNRVSKITAVIPAANWRYVKSEENPADCASRGLTPEKLINHNLWWHGPELLKNFKKEDSPQCFTTQEERIIPTNTYSIKQETIKDNFISTLLNKYSTMTHVVRVIAWVLRFIKRSATTFYLSTNELQQSADLIIKHMQHILFDEDYKQLAKDKTVSAKSKIFKLSPYIDESGIIRVGGRLKHSDLPLNMKNPIIIPNSGKLTQLVINQAHEATLHGGARLTLAYIRQKYWIIGGNRAVKSLLQRCVRCHRYNNKEHNQLMGNLPMPRVTPSRPFTHTGIDYTGHIDIKLNKGRGVKTSKGYIVIFICLATKAVHIELASDLSTDTFLAALERLCARRGTPLHIYTDNGTNFVGASRILRSECREFHKLLTPEFHDNVTRMGITWHFSAPTWASANGIWEAAVKSMKHHLRRVLGEQKLTFEEFTTLLSKIEACLNSRYLCPLTEDPDEFYNGLTPGHFLTGGPTLFIPQCDYSDAKTIDPRKRWKLVNHMSHMFWKHWSNEYLQQLQKRSKWNIPTRNLKEGDIVLVKEDNLPPGKWAMARVTQLHPGSDGYVRVATLKTQTKTITRPITKLSPLPTNEDEKSTFHLQLKQQV